MRKTLNLVDGYHIPLPPKQFKYDTCDIVMPAAAQ